MASLFWNETAALFSELKSSVPRGDKRSISNSSVNTLDTKQDFLGQATKRPNEVAAPDGRAGVGLEEEGSRPPGVAASCFGKRY